MSTPKLIIPEEYQPLFFFANNRQNPPYRYFDFSGGRSSGKSTAVALALAIEGSMYPTRILCGREYQNSIKDSVKKLLEDQISRYKLPGYSSTVDSIRNANGTEFIFKGLHDNLEATVKSFEGIQRCWIEEAQTISEESLDILLPTIRVEGSTVIFTRNPLTPEDVITRRFVTEPTPLISARTYHVHTTWRTLERCGLLADEVLQQVREAEGTAIFAHTWEGLPYEHTTNQIITWPLLEAAMKRDPQTDGGVSFGVDVARYGNDRTALAIVRGQHLEQLVSWRHQSIVESYERIATLAATYHPTIIKTDDTGVGGGLTDLLRARGYPVSGINYSVKAKRPDHYPNVASELWFDFGERLDKISINPRLEQRSELFTELTTREWKITAQNLRQVQDKKDYKRVRQSGSPDLADSVLLAYYQPAIMPSWAVSI